MAEWNRNTPWRQGLLLTEEAIRALGLLHPGAADQSIVVVATHDCDLAQPPDSEPLVEVVIGQRIEKLDGNYSHAKTSRTLHIEFDGKPCLLAEFEVILKKTVPKTELATFTPLDSYCLSAANAATFQYWLASRYRRSAFPDEFEDRLKKNKLAEKISNAVKPHGKNIIAVFFDVDEGEEITRDGADDIYVLDIYLLHASEPDFLVAEQTANQAKDTIEKAFKSKLFDPTASWKSIELRYCDVVSETTMTYQQFKQLKRWRLDHISLGNDPQQPLMAE